MLAGHKVARLKLAKPRTTCSLSAEGHWLWLRVLSGGDAALHGGFISHWPPDSPGRQTGHSSRSRVKARKAGRGGRDLTLPTLTCSLKLTLRPRARMPLRGHSSPWGLKKQSAHAKKRERCGGRIPGRQQGAAEVGIRATRPPLAPVSSSIKWGYSDLA